MNHSGNANKMVSDTPRTDAAYAASTGAGIYELFKESQDIERELAAAQQRIKRLENAGDALKAAGYFGGFNDAVDKWIKVKEAKP